MGQVARIQTALGHTGVVLWITADQRFGVLLRHLHECGDVTQVVLAIGVHLQGVGEAQARGFAQPCHHRPALALVHGQADQEDVIAQGQVFEHGSAGGAAGVVDQHAGQAGGEQGVDHGGHGGFVVVHRDHGAGVMHGQISPGRCRRFVAAAEGCVRWRSRRKVWHLGFSGSTCKPVYDCCATGRSLRQLLRDYPQTASRTMRPLEQGAVALR